MELRLCSASDILELRHKVLRAGKPFHTAHFEGDDEPETRHYLLAEHGEVLVCLSLLQREMPPPDHGISFPAALFNAFEKRGCSDLHTVLLHPAKADNRLKAWQLRGMATADEVQGRGLGSRLIRFALEDAAATGYAPVFWCNARLRAVPFYERNGWIITSHEFDVPGIGPHHRMATCFVSTY